jgi:mono/diheme cytochrome c family protein
MIGKRTLMLIATALLAGAASWTFAQEKSAPPAAESAVAVAAASASSGSNATNGNTAPAKSSGPVKSNAEDRPEGEKRFRANCSRCHAAPHKFPPRMMATIVRHMRVRATITDEDMRLILAYMTQ